MYMYLFRSESETKPKQSHSPVPNKQERKYVKFISEYLRQMKNMYEQNRGYRRW